MLTLFFTLTAFQIDTVVAKANERRIFLHADFEAICSKFW